MFVAVLFTGVVSCENEHYQFAARSASPSSIMKINELNLQTVIPRYAFHSGAFALL